MFPLLLFARSPFILLFLLAALDLSLLMTRKLVAPFANRGAELLAAFAQGLAGGVHQHLGSTTHLIGLLAGQLLNFFHALGSLVLQFLQAVLHALSHLNGLLFQQAKHLGRNFGNGTVTLLDDLEQVIGRS